MEKTTDHIQQQLLDWFQKHKRDLPWRLKKSPYRTLVSEVMLQQTQIQTVIPYFNRWTKMFPTIYRLANAPMDRILKLWEGLGYYTRARNLLKTAKIIVDRFGGNIPDDVETLMTLPGIGRYTAGAIASIAYQKPAPIVDGNVSRVLSRLFYIRQDITETKTQKKLYDIASMILSKKAPGDFNQAMMELGSLVCFPAMPNCAACPVQQNCQAFKKGVQETLPIKRKSAKPKSVRLAIAIIRHKEKILVRKRPLKGIWAGLYELPNTVAKNQHDAQKRLFEYLSGELQMKQLHITKKPSFSHRLTHLDITFYPFLIDPAGSLPKNVSKKRFSWRWVSKSSLKQLSFPVPYRDLIKLAL